ncbi:MAG: hypothetical protein H0V17_18110 [Deltaproteobacteria bacterium]|nr:hypothetical protein [Deltaproteobacteria bacterium]
MRAAIIVLMLCAASAAAAHPLDTGYLRVDAEGDRVAISFDIDVVVAGELLKTEPGAIDPVLVTRANELADRTYRTAAPVAGGVACTWGTSTATRRGQTVSIAETATCPPGDVRWDLSFVTKLGSTFQILGKVRAHGTDQVITVDKSTTAIDFAGTNAGGTAAVWAGLAHTGVLPRGLPGGLEHILFVVVLVLAAGTFARSAIAVAMVIAGGLVGSVLPGVPPTVAIIGFAIAIAMAAAVATTRKLERQVWVISAFAGLCHGAGSGPGMGYAIGIALGHAALVLVIAPPLTMATAQDSIRKRVPVIAVACALGAIAFAIRGL